MCVCSTEGFLASASVWSSNLFFLLSKFKISCCSMQKYPLSFVLVGLQSQAQVYFDNLSVDRIIYIPHNDWKCY